MKNKLSTTFSQGFQSGTFIRVGENRDLSLFVGKDEKGNYAFDFRGTYVPVRISQSDVITVQQELIAIGVSKRKIAKICKVDRNTLARFIKENLEEQN